MLRTITIFFIVSYPASSREVWQVLPLPNFIEGLKREAQALSRSVRFHAPTLFRRRYFTGVATLLGLTLVLAGTMIAPPSCFNSTCKLKLEAGLGMTVEDISRSAPF